jgi:hypothetical protein
VVALLNCASEPTGGALASPPRFAPRAALVAAALAGASMTIAFMWLLHPGPAVISGETYWRLRQHHLVKNLTEVRNGEDKWLEGEVTTLDSPVVRDEGLTKRTFTLPVNDATGPKFAGNVPGDGLSITTVRTGGEMEMLRAPSWWQALIMLAVPVAFAVVIGRVLSPIRLLIGKD